jgi:hypothetical protein
MAATGMSHLDTPHTHAERKRSWFTWRSPSHGPLQATQGRDLPAPRQHGARVDLAQPLGETSGGT